MLHVFQQSAGYCFTSIEGQVFSMASCHVSHSLNLVSTWPVCPRVEEVSFWKLVSGSW